MAVITYVFRPVSDPFHHDAKICRIDEYGASKTDARKTREAFAQAFSACGGGGTVVVPMGTWVTGGITIPSDTTLYLNLFSTLSFSDEPDFYLPVVATRWEGMDVMNYQPLVYVPNAKNVAVLGHGTLKGNGERWWEWRDRRSGKKESEAAKELYDMAKNGVSVESRVFGSITRPLRPSFFQPYAAENVVVDSVRFVDGPMWTIHPVYSQNVRIRHVTVDTTGPNTDGIAVDSSEDVVVEGCCVGSGDDAIVIKSGLDYDGWKQNRPSRNIIIRNSTVFRGNAGVTIGSEMSGGVENVAVSDMIFRSVDTGIRIKTLKGRGGFVHNVRYENIVMRGVVEDAVQIDLDYKYATLKSQSMAIPEVQDVFLSHIRAYASGTAFRVGGSREAGVHALYVRDSVFFVDDAGDMNDIASSSLQSVRMFAKNHKPLEMKNVQNVRVAGYFPRGALGEVFAKVRGDRSRDIDVRIVPCLREVCVVWAK